jgi:hypothetical protein
MPTAVDRDFYENFGIENRNVYKLGKTAHNLALEHVPTKQQLFVNKAELVQQEVILICL